MKAPTVAKSLIALLLLLSAVAWGQGAPTDCDTTFVESTCRQVSFPSWTVYTTTGTPIDSTMENRTAPHHSRLRLAWRQWVLNGGFFTADSSGCFAELGNLSKAEILQYGLADTSLALISDEEIRLSLVARATPEAWAAIAAHNAFVDSVAAALADSLAAAALADTLDGEI